MMIWTKHSMAYRSGFLLLRRPPGREAYLVTYSICIRVCWKEHLVLIADEVEKLTGGKVKGKTGSLTAYANY